MGHDQKARDSEGGVDGQDNVNLKSATPTWTQVMLQCEIATGARGALFNVFILAIFWEVGSK